MFSRTGWPRFFEVFEVYVNLQLSFPLLRLFFVVLLFYVSCFIMTSNSSTMEELRGTFHEKLAPLKAEIGELRAFIEHANEKYDDVLKKLKEQEKQNKEIIKENQFLRSTVKALDSHAKKLQVACNDLQQYSRRGCLEI